MDQYARLFEPIRIGSMEVRNRLAMAPMTVDYGDPDETPSDRQIAYYAERARGGVGLIGVEVCTVDPKHRYQQHSIGLHSDAQIPRHRELVEAIHAHGAKVQPQLSHTGPESLAPFFEGLQPMGPSVIRTETTKQACREISAEELAALVSLYGDAAVRAREAGYDGVELHAAHSYMLLGSFLSPLRNFRTDEYAGHRFEGRAKLLLEVVADIRKKVGRDFPLTVRLSGFERESGGREVNDTQRLAPLLVEAGVDCFHVSGGVGDANITQIITGPEYRPGYNVAAAAAIKQVVDVPVMVVGQNMDPAALAEIVASDRADIVAMGRALLADPELPNKVREGRVREVNRCILCQYCVDVMTAKNQGTGCAVNPRTGQEREYAAGPVESPRHVVVVGGGPAGLFAAKTAAERGHRVTLFERESTLGGAFRWASAVFPPNQHFLEYLVDRVRSLPVEVKLAEPATPAGLRALAPDAILVATGGRVEAPSLPGVEAPHVIAGERVLELAAQLAERDGVPDEVGETVVVVGGNLIGLELAEQLAQRGRRVHVVEPSGRLAMPAGKKRRGDHAKRLDTLGVAINTGVAVAGIAPDGVVLALAGGREHTVRGDTVIVAPEIVADTALYDALRTLAPEVHAIGDATGFGLSAKAVADAAEVVYRL